MTAFSALAIGVSFLLNGDTVAQQPTIEGRVSPSWQDALPKDPGGPAIAEADRFWAYCATTIGFLVVFVAVGFLVEYLAKLIICILLVGGIGLLCWLVSEGYVATWPMLALTTGCVGCYCAAGGIIAALFANEPGPSETKYKQLADDLAAQKDLVAQLSRDVAELKGRLTQELRK